MENKKEIQNKIHISWEKDTDKGKVIKNNGQIEKKY